MVRIIRLLIEKLGHRHFEIDFNWTNDNQLALIHDWNATYKKWFGISSGKAPSLAEFMSLPMNHGRTQMTLDSLATWLESHADAFIVTDIKRDNIRALETIKRQHPKLQSRIIPQIYQLEEYPAVAELGYKDIILTLYKARANDREIFDFAKQTKLFAVTGWTGKLKSGRLIENLTAAEVPVFVHTVNYLHSAIPFLQRGVTGIYTDRLSAEQLDAYPD